MSGSPRAGCLPRIGGALALDFANTTTGRGTARFVEHLFDHEDLTRWAAFNGLLTPEAGAALTARLTPREREAGFAAAVRLRALLNRVFDALARGGGAAPADLDALADGAVGAWRGARLVAPDHRAAGTAAARHAWRFPPAADGTDALLAAVLRSAAEVLTRRDPARLKACPGEACGWVFLDATKNGGRVWCEMEVCGARAKLRKRARARRLGRGAPPPPAR